jgi:beta-lactamase class A
MKSKALWIILGILGLLFAAASVVIAVREYRRYQAQVAVFPSGAMIGGIPAAGLDVDEAALRLDAIYDAPIVLYYEDAVIYADPVDLGFSMDVDRMLSEARSSSQLGTFFSYLWGRESSVEVTVPLEASVDADVLESYLVDQIASRYDTPQTPLQPIMGTTNLQPGTPGDYLDVQSAMTDIEAALRSADLASRTVTLTVLDQAPNDQIPPEVATAFLQHQINWSGFDGLVEIYLQSLESDLAIRFAVQDGEMVEPDVAFTAASTIKIPIMVSVLRRTSEPTPSEVVDLLTRMIVFSENPPADTLMSTYLDDIRGPLMVTEDMRELGFENTFLAGYFYLGAPLLQLYDTPANNRTDIFLDPDVYNQTVPGEIGQLLAAIAQCAADGNGLLVDTFGDDITPSECQLMLDTLSANKIGLLIEAGLPPEAQIAHKHGWVQALDGLLHSMSDVAVVSTPGGDYVLNVFIHDTERLDFDAGNILIARLSQTVYNFFNINDQAYWWYE